MQKYFIVFKRKYKNKMRHLWKLIFTNLIKVTNHLSTNSQNKIFLKTSTDKYDIFERKPTTYLLRPGIKIRCALREKCRQEGRCCIATGSVNGIRSRPWERNAIAARPKAPTSKHKRALASYRSTVLSAVPILYSVESNRKFFHAYTSPANIPSNN